jgi:hypothetical protein
MPTCALETYNVVVDFINRKRQANRIFFYPPAGVIMWPIKLPQEDGHVTAKTTERKKRRAP